MPSENLLLSDGIKLAPSLLKALASIGIHTSHDLRQQGAVATFLLLKAKGCTITNSILWQLHAICSNLKTPHISDEEKKQLLQAVKQHPPVAIFPEMEQMQYFMQHALIQAQLAAEKGEVPVGAVVVHHQQMIASAHNSCISDCDISRHAELSALSQAGQKMGNYRLDNCDVYITLEPCAMCASALIQARVKRVIFGASEPKTGAAGSVINLFSDGILNQHTAIYGGVLAEKCQNVLQQFFQKRR